MKRANLSVRSGRPSISPSRSAFAALAALALLVPGQSAAHANASAVATDPVPVPSVVGYPPVASTSDTVAVPLPKKNGTVKVDASKEIRTADGASASPDATLRADAFAQAEAVAQAVTAATAKVALRALVVAVDAPTSASRRGRRPSTGSAPPTTCSTPRPRR